MWRRERWGERESGSVDGCGGGVESDDRVWGSEREEEDDPRVGYEKGSNRGTAGEGGADWK